MEAAAFARQQADSQSTSYIRVRTKSNALSPFSPQLQYEMLEPLGGGEYGPKTFYGQLEHIYTITFPVGCPELQITHPTTCIIACIHWCKIKKDHPQLARLDIHLYREDDTHINITDITSIQCLVGHVRDGPS